MTITSTPKVWDNFVTAREISARESLSALEASTAKGIPLVCKKFRARMSSSVGSWRMSRIINAIRMFALVRYSPMLSLQPLLPPFAKP